MENWSEASNSPGDTLACRSPSPVFLLAPSNVAFLTRHGVGHFINPSNVPGRANIAALKSLGVRAIVAFSVVGFLHEEISPGSFAILSQNIDRTKEIRPASFLQDNSIVVHTMFGDPLSNKLVK
jgi:5'-methylthioadenosine phosphorylase